MIRFILAVVAGLVVWMLCATGLDHLLRWTLPGYAAAEPQLNFTLTMMVARLALPGGVPSLCAGFAAAWVARGDARPPMAVAVLLLAMFVPVHYTLWSKFAPWYHLTFLGSLLVLTLLGARLYRAAPREAPARA